MEPQSTKLDTRYSGQLILPTKMTVNTLPKHTSITFLYIYTHVAIYQYQKFLYHYHNMENCITTIDISIILHITNNIVYIE